VPSERCSIEEQSIEILDGCVMFSDHVKVSKWHKAQLDRFNQYSLTHLRI
jgi:hypothetical protein